MVDIFLKRVVVVFIAQFHRAAFAVAGDTEGESPGTSVLAWLGPGRRVG